MKNTTDNDYDRSIHSNPDARAWADFFIKTWPKVMPGQKVPDEGWIMGWFANAMMAQHDHDYHKTRYRHVSDFAVWLTTRKKVIKAGASETVYDVFEALAEYCEDRYIKVPE